MKRNRSFVMGAVVVLGVGASALLGINAANASAGQQACSEQGTSSVPAEVSVDAHGKITKSGEVVDLSASAAPPFTAEQEAQMDALFRQHPEGTPLAIGVGKDGNVTATPASGSTQSSAFSGAGEEASK